MSSEKKVVLDYNNAPVPEGHVMVATAYDQLDVAENVTNPDCVISMHIPGTNKRTKAVLRAVKPEEVEECKKAYNRWQNDQLGHFSQKDTVSTEAMLEQGHEDAISYADNTARVVGKMNALDAVKRLIDETPQYAAAIYFLLSGLKGSAFQEQMQIGHTQSAKLQKELLEIFKVMIRDGYDVVTLKKNSTANDTYYRQLLEDNRREFLDRISAFFDIV